MRIGARHDGLLDIASRARRADRNAAIAAAILRAAMAADRWRRHDAGGRGLKADMLRRHRHFFWRGGGQPARMLACTAPDDRAFGLARPAAMR